MTPHMQQKEMFTEKRRGVGCDDVADTILQYGRIVVQSVQAGMQLQTTLKITYQQICLP